MYAIYRELHPPTGVEHCLECHFFNGKSKNLAVAAASMLKVYDLCCVSCVVGPGVSCVSHTPSQVEGGTDKDGAGMYV